VRDNQTGNLSVLCADEREILSGFWPFYTVAGDEDYEKMPMAQKQFIEDQRLAQIGNSFHTLPTTWLCAQGLAAVGLIAQPRSSKELQEEFIKEAARRRASATSPGGALPSSTLYAMPATTETELMGALVHGLLRGADHRGSDVRLDIGLPFRASAWPRSTVNPARWTWKVVLAYPWRRAQHINLLELRAIFAAMRWKAPSPRNFRIRKCIITDSHVALSVAAKCRSSSKRLNRILWRTNAVALTTYSHYVFVYVRAGVNAADPPSRINGT